VVAKLARFQFRASNQWIDGGHSRTAGDFDDDQLAELASLTRYSPVRDIVSNSSPSPST
jgi:hypothetical protein